MENFKKKTTQEVFAAKGRERWQFDGIAGLLTQQLCQHLAFFPKPCSNRQRPVHLRPGASEKKNQHVALRPGASEKQNQHVALCAGVAWSL